ncbi:Peroxiredoxin [Bacillus pseudomycoides]
MHIVNADYSAVPPGEDEDFFSSFSGEVENGKNALVYNVKNVRNIFW